MLALPARLATISFIGAAEAWSLAPVPDGVAELRLVGAWPNRSGSAIAAAVTWTAAPTPITTAARGLI